MMSTCDTMVIGVFDSEDDAKEAARVYTGLATIVIVTGKLIVNTDPSAASTTMAGPKFVLIVQS